MASWLNKWFLGAEIEERIYLTALAISFPYFGINIVFDLIYLTQIQYLLLDTSLLLVCILFVYLRRFTRMKGLLMNTFSLILFAGFMFFWMTSGGIRGGASYIFPVLAVFIISITSGISRYFFLILFVSLVFILSSNLLPISGEAVYQNLIFEFFINFVLLGLIFITFKFALDHERFDLEVQNMKINKVNKALTQKSKELEDYNNEIKVIQQNLEGVVDKRTRLLEEEHRKNVEYSFINAHLVRAPLSNILAITQNINEEDVELRELKESAQALDTTVRKIGEILSIK